MRCPHAKRATRLIFDREGNAFCPPCYHGPRGDRNVYSGRKIWTAYEAYGVRKTIQKNRDWIEKVGERAAGMRRTAHHSRF